MTTLACLVMAGPGFGPLSWAAPPVAHVKSPLTFGFIADGGLWNAGAQQVALSLSKSGVYDLIMAGDNLYDGAGAYADAWAPWQQDGFRFPVVAIGNHNLGYPNEIKYFGMSGEYYAKSLGDSLFIVLNSDNGATVSEQAAFLKQKLGQAKEKYVFLVYHHPSYTMTDFHNWKDKEAFQLAIRPLLKTYAKRITAVLVGHDHIAALAQIDELPMVVSGAVFEERQGKKVNYQAEDGAKIKSAWVFQGSPHWARLDVQATEVWLNFVRADNDNVDCSARLFPRPMLLRDNCAKTGL